MKFGISQSLDKIVIFKPFYDLYNLEISEYTFLIAQCKNILNMSIKWLIIYAKTNHLDSNFKLFLKVGKQFY